MVLRAITALRAGEMAENAYNKPTFCVVDQLGSDPWEADPCYSLGTFPLLEAVNNHEEVPSGDP